MARITTVQASHTYGVLDPLIIERRDTKFVPGSLADGLNIIMLPQGGYRDRGGSTDFSRVRKALSEVAISSGMLTLSNGGTAADLLDPDETITTSAASGTRFVLFEIDFGSATKLHFIDVDGVSIASTGASGALIAEYYDGADWQAFGAALALDLTSRNRRFASGGPGHAGHTAQQFRVAVDATTAAGAVSVSGVSAHVETSTKTDAIVQPFTGEDASETEIVFTAGNADIFKVGVWKASANWPVTESQLRKVKPEQRYDTLLGFEQDLQPHRLLRMGDDAEWSSAPITFTNVPLVDYGGVYTNGVNEKQEITLYSISEGQQFELTLEGLTTTAIARGASGAATAASITSALEALSNTDSGITVTASSTTTFVIEFTGGANAERDWLVMGATALDGDGFVRVRTLQEGKAAGEPIISASAGWPAVGRFVKQRLLLGGLKKRPNDVLGSVQGDPYNLNTEIAVSTAAFSYEVEFPDNTVIRDMVSASALVILGDKQLAFLRDNTLSATTAPNFGFSDSPGVKQQVALTSSDNALFYVQEGGNTLRLANYTALEENYVADNASILSAHLVRDPIDMRRRRASGIVNADLLVMVNADGTATVLTMMRTQEVSGFAPWSTDGSYVAIAVTRSNTMWMLMEREIDGTAEIRLERHDPDGYLDEAITLEIAVATTTITGLSRFNGRDVWLQHDGSFSGPFTVSGGEVECDIALSGTVVAGSWIAPFGTDPKVSLAEETQRRPARLKRVCRAEVSIYNTTSLAIAANGAPAVNMPLHTSDSVITDLGPLDQPVTGKVMAEGMHGFTEEGQVTITQVFPGRMITRSLEKDVVA
ncbi:hypothetical protein [Oricola sp.]|uniref:hypothetical protein n=1 Tax=Oricola sp. TaxID=1979950 RepID=UPI0025CE8ED9|nr:hypothetical protein [Oricola sp.]MCI5075645.1 hypothetical protein [Oricola sp.]